MSMGCYFFSLDIEFLNKKDCESGYDTLRNNDKQVLGWDTPRTRRVGVSHRRQPEWTMSYTKIQHRRVYIVAKQTWYDTVDQHPKDELSSQVFGVCRVRRFPEIWDTPSSYPFLDGIFNCKATIGDPHDELDPPKWIWTARSHAGCAGGSAGSGLCCDLLPVRELREHRRAGTWVVVSKGSHGGFRFVMGVPWSSSS